MAGKQGNLKWVFLIFLALALVSIAAIALNESDNNTDNFSVDLNDSLVLGNSSNETVLNLTNSSEIVAGNATNDSVVSSETNQTEVTIPEANAIVPSSCVPDVSFSSEDLEKKGDTATFGKDGISIVLRGAGSSSVKFPEFKNNIFTVDVVVANATISIPRCGASSVMIQPRLYVRENGKDFVLARPRCSGSFCFNDVKVTATSYVFSVEHFSDYYVNDSGGNFSSVEACFDAINNTADRCVLAVSNYSETFSSSKNYYFSVSALSLNDQENITLDFSSSVMVLPSGVYFADATAGNNVLKNVEVSGGNGFYTNAGSGSKENLTFSGISVHDCNWGVFSDSTSAGHIWVSDSEFNCSEYNINPYTQLTLVNVTSRIGNVTSWGGSYIDGLKLYDGSVLVLTNYNGFPIDNLTIKNTNFTGSTFVIAVPSVSNFTLADSFFDGITAAHAISLTSYNDEGYGIWYNFENIVIENNTFRNCGALSFSDHYLVGDSAYGYGGNSFNGAPPMLLNSGLSSYIVIDQNGKDVTDKVTGQNNFSLWLINLPALGVSNASLYVEQPNGMSCADVAAYYGGTCYLDEQDFLQANGPGQDYSVKNVTGLSIIQGADPAFLNYNNQTSYDSTPIFLFNTSNVNITGNMFVNNSAPVVINGTGTNLWLNHFLDFSPVNFSEYNACVNGSGNYYADGLAPLAGDCSASIDVFNLSRLYGSSLYSVFEFMVKTFSNDSVSWLFAPGAGQDNVTSGLGLPLNSGETVFVYVEKNYTSVGNYTVVAYANGSSGSDQESVGVEVG